MIETLASITGYFILGIVGLMLLICVLSYNKNSNSRVLWHFITWVQFYQWIPLINSSAPLDYFNFFSHLNTTINVYQFVTYSYPNTIPSNYSYLGIQYSYFINNTEKLLVVWGICIIIYMTAIFTTWEWAKAFRKSICDNLILRIHLICFGLFSIFSLLQIIEFEITTWYGIMNSVVSVAIFLSNIVLIFFVPIYSYIRIDQGLPEELERIETIVKEFKTDKKGCMFYYVFFMLERLTAAVSYAFLASYPGLQCLFIGLALALNSNLYLVVYLAVLRPFENITDTFFVVSLEFCSLLCVSLNFVFVVNQVSSQFMTCVQWLCFSFLWLGIGLTVIKYMSVVYKPSVTKINISNVTSADIKDASSIDQNDGESNLDINQNKDLATGIKLVTPNNTKKESPVEGSRGIILDINNFENENYRHHSVIPENRTSSKLSINPERSPRSSRSKNPSTYMFKNNPENSRVDLTDLEYDNIHEYGKGITYYNSLLKRYQKK